MAETASYVSELRAKALFVTQDGKEICVICRTVTDVDFETPVDVRQHYIQGQHCVLCCQKFKLC